MRAGVMFSKVSTVVAGAAAITCLVLAAGQPAHASSAGASASCAKLPITTSLRHTLKRTHVAQLRHFGNDQTVKGPKGVHYGRCGSTRYALASFSHDGDFTDQPEHFRRAKGKKWNDLGDTGGDVCGTAPKALLKLWGYGKRCQLK